MKTTIFCFSFLLTVCLSTAQNDGWLTHFEKSGYLETADYEEVIRYSKMLAEASPFIEYVSFGTSPQNREMPLLIIDRNKNFTPEEVRKSQNAVLLIEAGIHPGEADGTDAVLMLARDLVITKKLTRLLDRVTFLIIPAFNVDGLARFGPYNRINQNGPLEMGWRANAMNLNLNRDFLKADSPEMQAWLRLFNKWLPDFFVDCHSTDGADYQYVLTYMTEIFGNMDEDLTKWQKEVFLPYINEEMNKTEYPVFQYVSFRRWHDPRSGLRSGTSEPRLSHGYSAIQNRPSLLIESHMLKPHKERVFGTYYLLKYTAELMNKEYQTIQQLNWQADARVASSSFRENPLPVSFKIDYSDSIMVEFKGFDYTVETSDLTGGNWFKYTDKPVTMKLPWFSKSVPTVEVKLPEAYIVPAEWQDVIERIDLHGIKYKTITEPLEIEVESYLFTNPRWRESPYEGRHVMSSIEYEGITETRTFPPGSIIIDMNDRAARVIAHMLEPKADDSYVYWGFFDAIFEQKEYSETYVMEEMAREMIAEDESLKEEFETRKAEDENFASNQWYMLNWFYSKTPYWDWKKNKYPVGKVYDRNQVENLINN